MLRVSLVLTKVQFDLLTQLEGFPCIVLSLEIVLGPLHLLLLALRQSLPLAGLFANDEVNLGVSCHFQGCASLVEQLGLLAQDRVKLELFRLLDVCVGIVLFLVTHQLAGWSDQVEHGLGPVFLGGDYLDLQRFELGFV